MDISTTPKVHIQTKVKRHLADTITPVSLYLKVRDHFTVPVLLESNDFSDAENCYSFVGLDEIGSFAVQKGTITYQFPGHKKETAPGGRCHDRSQGLERFSRYFLTGV
jgi:anthranilate synthase component 1